MDVLPLSEVLLLKLIFNFIWLNINNILVWNVFLDVVLHLIDVGFIACNISLINLYNLLER